MTNSKNIKINIPKFPKLILQRLKENGFEGYIVGGCVRDFLLGKNPDDFDITTNAKPEDVKRIFKKTIDTGIKHGTVTILFYDNNKPLTYEITTYRVDGEYIDGRHPENVKFVSGLKEDLARRDFTVNAMAYNDEDGIVDEFDGITDIEKKLIRSVGNPIDRFTEDALRLLRAVRFSAKLGFEIEEETKIAIPILSKNLSMVSKERIQVELTKTITSDNPEHVANIFSLNLAPYICKDFEKVIIGKFEKRLKTHLAYACLLFNESDIYAKQFLRELKLDNACITKVTNLLKAKNIYYNIVKFYDDSDELSLVLELKNLINFLDYDLTYDFIRLLEINLKNDKLLKKIENLVDSYKKDDVPIFIKDLNIKGEDLIEIGFREKEIGIALNELLKIVHKNRDFNTKKLLQEIAKKAYNKYISL